MSTENVKASSGPAGNRSTSISKSIAFSGTGSYEDLLLIDVSELGSEKVRVRGTVSTSALTGLKVTKSVVSGGTHSDYLVDADLDTAFGMMPWTSKTASGTSLYLTPAGSAFEFLLDVSGLSEIKVQVKASAGGSIAFEIAA